MSIKQLSIFAENKPGRMYDITKFLADANIDIRALSIADTTDFGIMRLIVNKPDEAYKSLGEAGFTVSLTDVAAVAIDDRPGGLCEVMKIVAENGITVEYAYAFIGKMEHSACVILRLDNTPKAVEVLEKNNIRLLYDV